MHDSSKDLAGAHEEQHSAIRRLLRWVESDLARETASPEGVQGGGPLLGPLSSLREHLARHFGFEEQSGLIPRAILTGENGEVRLREWLRQHRDFLQRLDRAIRLLRDAARSSVPPPPSFEPDLRSVLEDLRAHDAYEDAVLGHARSSTFRDHQRSFEERRT